MNYTNTIRGPEFLLMQMWKKVPQYIRLTFTASMVLGFVAHLYIFTNKLPNHDDLAQLFWANGSGAAVGRWLLPVILKLDGNFSMPWLIGVLGLVCLAGTACFTVSLLRIHQPVSCILTAALMTTFPPVAATFSYMYLADAYFFGLMLAVFGAWITVRYRLGFIWGGVALTLSMGIYQSYFGSMAVLAVGGLLLETLDGEKGIKELLLRGAKFAGTLAAGMGMYLVIVRYTTRQVPLSDYMGISEMGSISLREIPHRLWQCLRGYHSFFAENSQHVHFEFLKYVFILAAVSALILLFILLRQRRLEFPKVILAVCLIAAYFLAGDIIYLMTPGWVHSLMIYGLCFVLLLPLVLSEYLLEMPLEGWTTSLRAGCSWVIVVTLMLTAYSYQIADNKAYLKMDISFQQCLSYSNRLLARIEGCEGYEPGMSVLLIGGQEREPALYPTPEMNEVVLTGSCELADYRSSYSYANILRYFCAFTGAVHCVNEDGMAQDAAFDIVKAMPLYPQRDSVRVIDGQVIVKLN